MNRLNSSRFGRLNSAAQVANPTYLVRSGRLLPGLSVSRTQTSGAQATAPSWALYAENTPRFRTDTGRMLLEAGRTNLVRNPRFEGGTPGVIGSGGVLPTNMTWAPGTNQTLEFVGVTTVQGIPCAEFIWTASASGAVASLTFDGSMSVTGAATYTHSLLCQIISGSTASLTTFGPRFRTSAVTIQTTPAVSMLAASTSSLQRFTSTHTLLADATTLQLQVAFTPNAAGSVRFYLAAPQVTLSSFALSPVLPVAATPGASTVGSDLFSVPFTSIGRATTGQGNLSVEALIPQSAPAAADQIILQLDDGSDNNRIVLRNTTAGNLVQMLAVVGGVSGTPVTVGTMTPGTAFTVNMEVDGVGGVRSNFNGGAFSQIWGAPVTGLAHLRVGSNFAGTSNLNGEIGQLIVSPSPTRSLQPPSAISTPADANYASSWWLYDANGVGDLQRIWGRYTGSTLTAMWLDSGIAYRDDASGVTADADVIPPKYDTSRHFVLNGVVQDGARIIAPTVDSDGHGTSTSKIAAAAIGGGADVGVAPGLRLTAVHAYNSATDIFLGGPNNHAQELAFRHYANFPVGYTKNRINSGVQPWRVGITHAADTGRGGLGTVIASPAANATSRLSGNLRYLQTISALAVTGLPDAATNWSSAMLAACPHPSGSFTSGASAAMVGVNALILEANPNLGWRDVKEIVSLTSLHTGSNLGTGPTAPENGLWQINGATNWCGGGRHWHQHYGFGKVDAQGAVGLAEAWRHIGATAQTSANEVISEQVSTGSITFNDANPTRTRTFTFAGSLQIETVTVAMNTGGAARLLQDLSLTSPSGTTIALGRVNVGEDSDGFMRFAVEGFRGELAAGVWTLTTTDSNTGDGLTGTWAEGRVTIYGRVPEANRQHIVTDDMAKMVTFSAGRSTLTAAGNGTLMGAALSGNATLNLSTGNCTIAGQACTLSGTYVAAFGGWGNDTITGNNSGNLLYGGWGNDSIVGGTGADTIIGGPGADTLTGGTGNDVFRYTSLWDSPESGPDTITDFNAATDVIDFAFGTSGTFIGNAAFTGQPLQARFTTDGANTVVWFDLDGDSQPDIRINLTGAIALTSSNFTFSAAI